MSIKQALLNVGGLSDPSKMPTFGTSIQANKCGIGSKLRKVLNSICSECYALKGRYIFDNVQNAMIRRLDALNNPLWIESMAFLMNNKKQNGKKGLDFFRWHDSGDLQNTRHLHMIVEVAKKSPNTKHWLPTRETKIVTEAIKKGLTIPDNLIIRLSAMAFDKQAPENTAKKFGLQVSGASKKDLWTCPSSKHIGGYSQNKKGEYKAEFGFCAGFTENGSYVNCRKCWDKKEFNIIYKAH